MIRWTRLIVGTATAAAIGLACYSSASAATPPAAAPAPAAPHAHDLGTAQQAAAKKQTQLLGKTSIPLTGFVPLSPCRAADTRSSAEGKLLPTVTRDFAVGGSQGFTAQGGKAGGCGVPQDAVAAAVSLTTVNSAGAGSLVAWPANTTKPMGTSLTTQKNIVLTGQITSRLGNAGLLDINSAAATNLVIDVVGYYREPISALIAYDGFVYAASSDFVSVSHPQTGSYIVTFSSDISLCEVEVTALGSNYNVGASNGAHDIYVNTRDVRQAGSPYADSGFNLTVTC